MRPPHYRNHLAGYAACGLLAIVSSACANARDDASSDPNPATPESDGTVMIQYRGRPMLAMRSNGQLLIEGDILVSPSDLGPDPAESPPASEPGKITQACRIASATDGIDYKWPGGVVPYEFAAGQFTATQQTAVQAVMTKLSGLVPGLGFRPANGSDTSAIRFQQNGGGCNSGVGRSAGQRTTVNLTGGCLSNPTDGDQGNLHEMLHALGLYHEQTRKDRDSYVSIAWGNVSGCPSTAKSQADCGWAHCSGNPSDCGCTSASDCGLFGNYWVDSGRVNLGPYDYASLMHYGPTGMQKGPGLVVMTALQPGGALMGTAVGLSQQDIANLQTMYPVDRVKRLIFRTPTGSYDLCLLDGREGDLSTAWTGSSTPALAALATGRTVPASQLALRDYSVTCNARSLFWASTYDYPNSTVFPNYSTAPASSIEQFSAAGSLRVLSAGLIPVLGGVAM